MGRTEKNPSRLFYLNGTASSKQKPKRTIRGESEPSVDGIGGTNDLAVCAINIINKPTRKSTTNAVNGIGFEFGVGVGGKKVDQHTHIHHFVTGSMADPFSAIERKRTGLVVGDESDSSERNCFDKHRHTDTCVHTLFASSCSSLLRLPLAFVMERGWFPPVLVCLRFSFFILAVFMCGNRVISILVVSVGKSLFLLFVFFLFLS